MNEQHRERRLSGPWAKIQAAFWLIGLAILAWQDWWWPGILVLIAISLIIQAILMRFSPQSFEQVEPPPEQVKQPPSIPPQPLTTPAPESIHEHRLELLPTECPKCGGPIRGHEVKWTGPQSADCPFCGANLPMAR